MDTAFQADAFQTDVLAFQIDAGGAPPAGTIQSLQGLILWGKPTRRFTIQQPKRQDDDDDFMGGLF